MKCSGVLALPPIMLGGPSSTEPHVSSVLGNILELVPGQFPPCRFLCSPPGTPTSGYYISWLDPLILFSSLHLLAFSSTFWEISSSLLSNSNIEFFCFHSYILTHMCVLFHSLQFCAIPSLFSLRILIMLFF